MSRHVCLSLLLVVSSKILLLNDIINGCSKCFFFKLHFNTSVNSPGTIKVSQRKSLLKTIQNAFPLKSLMECQWWTLAQMADRAFADTFIALHSLFCSITSIVRHHIAPFRYCRLKMYRLVAWALLYPVFTWILTAMADC